MYKVIEAPTVEPVTLEQLKAQARIEITDTEDDTSLTLRITAAREYIEKHCQIAMLSQTIEQRFPMIFDNMYLQVTPYQGTPVLKYEDVEDTTQTIPATDYEVNDFVKPNAVRLYASAPTISLKKALPVSFTYKAGYGDTAAAVPAQLREAVLVLANYMDAERTAPVNALEIIGHLIKPFINYYATI